METVNIVIIGAGVVGLAIAEELSKKYKEIVVLEKHNSFGQETSSRNSEVIHAGIYYPKDTLKAKLCVEGRALLYEICQKYNIPFKKIGKLIVASEEDEIPPLEELFKKADNMLYKAKETGRNISQRDQPHRPYCRKPVGLCPGHGSGV